MEKTSVDDLLKKHPNLHAAVSILINTMIDKNISLYEWDKIRREDSESQVISSNLIYRIETAKAVMYRKGLQPDNLVIGEKEEDELREIIKLTPKFIPKLEPNGKNGVEFMGLNLIIVPIKSHLSLSINGKR